LARIRFYDDIKSLKKALTELRKSLLKADVHYKVVKELIGVVEMETKAKGIGKENFLKALQQELTKILDSKWKSGVCVCLQAGNSCIDDRTSGFR